MLYFIYGANKILHRKVIICATIQRMYSMRSTIVFCAFVCLSQLAHLRPSRSRLSQARR